MDRKNKDRKKPLRSGRIKTEEKIAKSKRHEEVYPVGVDPSTCSHSHVRPIIRIEAGQALWVAYHIYRAPNGKYGVVPGALGSSEFGLEIILAQLPKQLALGVEKDWICNFFSHYISCFRILVSNENPIISNKIFDVRTGC